MIRILLAVSLLLGASGAWAQGQDGTPAERNLQLIAELMVAGRNPEQAFRVARRV